MVRRYQRKAVSDQALTLDSWWFVITPVVMLDLIHVMQQYAPLALLAFVAYKIVVWLGLPRVEPGTPRPLLLLRVFGHAKRSEDYSTKWTTLALCRADKPDRRNRPHDIVHRTG